ncbi:MAG: M13 family metallopeptidase [Halioglobus sp.]
MRATLILALSASLISTACSDGGSSKTPATATPTPDTATESVKASIGDWGVDLSARDLSVKPGDDFFRFVNGTWLSTTEIPTDRTSTGVSLAIHERAQERVRAIIEELGARSGEPGSNEQKVGDYYASWMATDRLDELGISPLQPDLDRIAHIDNNAALAGEFGQLHYISGVSPIMQGLGFDPKNPDSYNINIGLGGLGLPERDYYLDETERFVKIREQYLAHIARMLTFAGIEKTAEKAADILALETRIAGYQWQRADRRDRDKTYNPMTVADLKTSHADFDWQAYLDAGNMSTLTEVNVNHPDTLAPLIELINTEDLNTWKVYLSYHLISNNASVLSQEIDRANFDFWGKVINGSEQQLDRWKRGVSRVASKTGLGEALGQIYVERHFPESSKAKMTVLVENLRKAYGERIEALDWMSDETKQEALAKLAAFNAKIGYPDKWMDLADISINKDDLFDNTRNVRKFFEDYDANRLGNKTDREEWFMMPQTVNAYYLPSFNEIVFPAAILEPPYFDANADDAVNYGAIGSIIGHEMGHGFDDQGSKSDANGVKRDWWTEDDRAAFQARIGRLGEQFDQYEAVPGYYVDGAFTMGENIGDLGGVEVALRAYEISLEGGVAPALDGYSGVQRFFLSYGQSWRTMRREEAELNLLKSDQHSPAEFRVNGIVRNMDSWYEVFGVETDDALYLTPQERVSIW